MTLGEVPLGTIVSVARIGGERAFRRRMMEFGVLPGTRVEVVRVAPLGDPLELRVRGCLLSVRRDEARCIGVVAVADAGARPLVESSPDVAMPPSVPAAP